jgi:colanic acid biosynthesis glycosyl transferase WcaI
VRILVVSQYYPPEPVPIPAEVAHDLAAKGHSVRVLTGFPNYPAGSIFDGYRQCWRARETDGTVQVQRVPLFADHSQNPIRRLANYTTFALSSASARAFARGVDVVYVYATQMTAGLGPWLWRLTGGAPYVLHVQDLWPDSVLGSDLVRSGRVSRLIRRVLEPWLRSVYGRAGAVVGIAPTMVRTLVSRGVPEQRAHLVYNWAGTAEGSHHRSSTGTTTVLYAGNVGQMQDLETAVRAAHAARDAGIRLRIVGDGSLRERLVALSAELGSSNVEFLPPVPREKMPQMYADSDFGLVSLKDLPAFHGTIPSKLQGLLAAGLPVVSTVPGDVRSFVDAHGVGVTAAAEDAVSLEQAFRAAARLSPDERQQMAEAARRAYTDFFSREAGVAALEEILLSISK